MSNLSKLTEAGLIVASAALTPADMTVINSLTEAEVSALISIHEKVPVDFLQRNCGSDTPVASPAHTVGIVF